MRGLLDPLSGAALAAAGPHALGAPGGRRWPVIDGIPFLRAGREALADDILAALDRGDATGALILALSDRDDHARGPGPSGEALAHVATGAAPTLRAAMDALSYGPVAGYFAHRWSAPTFLSALALLGDHWRPGRTVIEIACGIGQILREAAVAGAPVIGFDVVFSKLWLARTYVVGADVPLICADAARGVPLVEAEPATVLCHDALYFIPEKEAVVAEMARLATPEGSVLIGHAHNANVDQRGVGGTPLTPAAWSALLPEARLHDDAAAALAWAARASVPEASVGALEQTEAIALSTGTPNAEPLPIGRPRPGGALRLNPLLVADADHLRPAWPNESLATEYAEARYLTGERMPEAAILAEAARGGTSAEIERLVRARVLLDLPEAW